MRRRIDPGRVRSVDSDVVRCGGLLLPRQPPRRSGRASFVEGLADFHVVAPEPEDWVRIGELVRQYDDLRLGTVDASVVVLAERMRTRQILTLDRRHFSVVKDAKGQAFELQP